MFRVAPGSPRLCAVLLQVSDALGGAGSQQHRPRDLPGAAAWSSLRKVWSNWEGSNSRDVKLRCNSSRLESCVRSHDDQQQ